MKCFEKKRSCIQTNNDDKHISYMISEDILVVFSDKDKEIL